MSLKCSVIWLQSLPAAFLQAGWRLLVLGARGRIWPTSLNYPLKGRIQCSALRMRPVLMELVLRAQISQEAHRASFLA